MLTICGQRAHLRRASVVGVVDLLVNLESLFEETLLDTSGSAICSVSYWVKTLGFVVHKASLVRLCRW